MILKSVLEHLISQVGHQMRIWPGEKDRWMRGVIADTLRTLRGEIKGMQGPDDGWIHEFIDHPETGQYLETVANAAADFFQHVEEAKASDRAKQSGLN